jgi:hypothetical protein
VSIKSLYLTVFFVRTTLYIPNRQQNKTDLNYGKVKIQFGLKLNFFFHNIYSKIWKKQKVFYVVAPAEKASQK